jgi:hypothetical protein
MLHQPGCGGWPCRPAGGGLQLSSSSTAGITSAADPTSWEGLCVKPGVQPLGAWPGMGEEVPGPRLSGNAWRGDRLGIKSKAAAA